MLNCSGCISKSHLLLLCFFFNDTATTEIYTLSLHDALPIFPKPLRSTSRTCGMPLLFLGRDRKSTRLNSSHANISYAVFCLKKKKNHNNHHSITKKKKKQTQNIVLHNIN